MAENKNKNSKRLCYNSSMKRPFRRGFTMVELSISMVFIGLLSLSVVLVINNAVLAYRRGNTLGQINSIGMDVVDDIKMSIQGTTARTLIGVCAQLFEDESERERCENDEAFNFVSVVKYSTVTLHEGTSHRQILNNLPIYGVFCTGTYSYIWNTGYFDSTEATFNEKTSKEWAQLVYAGGSVTSSEWDSNKPFRLLKVRDDNRSVCIATVYPGYKTSISESTTGLKYIDNRTFENSLFSRNVINITNINGGELDEDPIDLITSKGEENLALYDLLVSRPAASMPNDNVYYPISFVLGTLDGGINITAQGRTCAAPNDYEGNLDYCAINKFSFAARATGGDRHNGQV